MSDELKPCPFCGGRAKLIMAMGETWAVCRKCNACTAMESSRGKAVAAWNARAAVTEGQFAAAVHDGRVWKPVRKCQMELQYCLDPGGNVFCWTCSECGNDAFGAYHVDYCPNCGAKVVG